MNVLSVRWARTQPGSAAHGGRNCAGLHQPLAAEFAQRRDREEVELAREQQRERVGAPGDEGSPDERGHREVAGQVGAVLGERGAAGHRRAAEDPSGRLERLLGGGGAVEEPSVQLDEVGAVDHQLHGDDAVGEPTQPVEAERAGHVLGVDGKALLGAGGAGMSDGEDGNVGLRPPVQAGADVDERLVVEELCCVLGGELGAAADLDPAGRWRWRWPTARRRASTSGAASPKCSCTSSSMNAATCSPVRDRTTGGTRSASWSSVSASCTRSASSSGVAGSNRSG